MSHDNKMADGDDLEDEKKTIDASEVNLPAIDDGDGGDEEEEDDELYDGSDLESLVDGCAEEYTDLNNTLDKLDVCLDTLEERSDNLYSKFKDLLESSRQARHELQELHQQDVSGSARDKQS